MKRLILLIVSLLVVQLSIFAQTPPPPPPPADPPPMESVGQVQNATGFVQSKSFNPPGGSMVKPNPFLAGADLAIIQNPTFEGGFRPGFSMGYVKTSFDGVNSFGGNALATFDITQRAVNLFYGRLYKNHTTYYSASFAQIGMDCSYGPAVTRVWKLKRFNAGSTIGFTFVDGIGYRIWSPNLVFLINKPIKINSRFKWTPEIFATFADLYYNRKETTWDRDLTCNALVGNAIGINFGKKFVFNIDWRMNINTNPKLGIMHNILLGTNYKF